MKEVNVLFIYFITIAVSLHSAFSIRTYFKNYHQEIIYPLPRDFWKSGVVYRQYPEQQISRVFKLDNFRLKSSLPLAPQLNLLPTSVKVSGTSGPPSYPLFTPNTIDQRPETVGQIEEYKKALAEEAEEKRKENEGNEISSTFGKYLDLGGYDGSTKSYVDVKGDTYVYKYRV